MSSIRKVAKDAGVSIATVSRVINGSGAVTPDMRDRVMASVAKCGYSPTVGRKSHGSIALVYAGPCTIASPYDSACLAGIVGAMEESPFDLQIVNIRRDKRPDETFAQFFMRRSVEGAIVRCTAAERRLVSQIHQDGFPVVVLGDHFEAEGLKFVYNDSQAASQEAVEYLISLGHRDIAFAASDRDDGDHLDRLRSYRETMSQHGLADDRLIYKLPAIQEDGTQLMRKMLGAARRPTAVFIADPLVALGAINEAHNLGVRIPDDMSFVGFDDAELRYAVHPKMTAVCQNSVELGSRAFQYLVHQTTENPASVPPELRGEAWLEIHHSSGPVPAGAASRSETVTSGAGV